MLVQALFQVACYTGVEDCIVFIGEDVDVVGFGHLLRDIKFGE